MNNKIILAIVVVVVILFSGLLLLRKGATTPALTNTSSGTTNTTSNQTVDTNHGEHVVTVTSDGFNPNSITIKVGDKVIWKNQSGTTVTVNSDLHPTHLLWPFLNLGAFDDGSSVSVSFDKSGIYTYHNHLNASQKGTVTVQ